jgi:Na+/melibiose symporter-like transporter
MGVITAETNNKRTVGTSLSYIYVGYSVFFVLFSIIIGWKIKKIFFTIMKHEEWVKRNESLRNMDEKSQERDEFHQLDYFWGSDPTVIIVVCQFMQFGFALALGILLVFNENVYDKQRPFSWVGWYFVAPFLCYILFVVSECIDVS